MAPLRLWANFSDVFCCRSGSLPLKAVERKLILWSKYLFVIKSIHCRLVIWWTDWWWNIYSMIKESTEHISILINMFTLKHLHWCKTIYRMTVCDYTSRARRMHITVKHKLADSSRLLVSLSIWQRTQTGWGQCLRFSNQSKEKSSGSKTLHCWRNEDKNV
jgi:hypothetical protein